MKATLFAIILVFALALPAAAQTSTYPPSPPPPPPPVCVDPPCNTADTGSDTVAYIVGIAILIILGGALVLRRRQ